MDTLARVGCWTSAVEKEPIGNGSGVDGRTWLAIMAGTDSEGTSVKIVFAASEVAPFSKTGGLGDVAGALPEALSRLGHDVMVVTPLYGTIDRRAHGIWPTTASVLGCPLHERVLPCGTRVVFVENEGFFGRGGIYNEGGYDYGDNPLRFGFFCRALLQVPGAMGFGTPDVLHLNDWQTGLAALESSRQKGRRPGFTRTVFTIHNLGYQGVFDKRFMDELQIGWDAFTPWGLEFYDQINFMKAGLAFSDTLTTVSPTYSREIQGTEQGFGLDGMLRDRADRLVGILNGVDYREWNPESDPHLPARYGPSDLAGKRRCRSSLLEEMGIEDRPGMMLLGVVSRLAHQKGLDILLQALEGLMARNVALVVLGSGEWKYEHGLKMAEAGHPGRISVRLGYDNGLAHRIEAGADGFLMPSLYEPCGLNQMYSLKYGTVPIVRATGGLVDTVIDATVPGTVGTGFRFQDFDSGALLDAVDRAARAFAHEARWEEIRRWGMEQDFSWDASARRYVEAYRMT